MYVGLIMLNNVLKLSNIYETFDKKRGDSVDATCGNGYDTVLLSDLTGKSGKCWLLMAAGCDFQNRRTIEKK
jgi:hypothetical protein